MPPSSASRGDAQQTLRFLRDPPTATVLAVSPWKPLVMAPRSSPTMSPSERTTGREGMPWTTTSLSEAQMHAGKPR